MLFSNNIYIFLYEIIHFQDSNVEFGPAQNIEYSPKDPFPNMD